LCSFAPGTVELAADVGAGQADRASAAAAAGGEPVAEKHALPDLQAVGEQGGAGVVVQLRPGAAELAADVGTGQDDPAAASVAYDPRTAQVEQAACEPGAVQRWLNGVFDLASGQDDISQAGIPSQDALPPEGNLPAQG